MAAIIRKMFHTQERWSQRLTSPMPTNNPESWLGDGYYFWYDETDASRWGINCKRETGYYEIYTADINCENVLDTVFNEAHYHFWIVNVERAIEKFMKGQKGTLTIKYINDFFKDKRLLEDMDGVMFQDISNSKDVWVLNKFQYKKRIQLVVYNLPIMSNFVYYFEGKCV